ncbi:bifunctional 3-dehydroquinate dehydratase/shikimate dehydrogenase, chloroplastic-like protein [Tanacetum coccineum]
MGSVGVVRNATMVCVPLMSEYVEKMVGDMFEAKIEGADMLELRLDCLKDFYPKRDLPTLLSNKPLPVVVVYRHCYLQKETFFCNKCFL